MTDFEQQNHETLGGEVSSQPRTAEAQEARLQEQQAAGESYRPRDPEMEQRADQDEPTVARDRETHGDPTMAQGGAPAEVSGMVAGEDIPDGPAVGLDPTERRNAFEDGRPVDGEGNVH